MFQFRQQLIPPPLPALHPDPPLLRHPPYYWLRLFSSQNFLPYEHPNNSQKLVILHLTAFEDGTDGVFRNIGRSRRIFRAKKSSVRFPSEEK